MLFPFVVIRCTLVCLAVRCCCSLYCVVFRDMVLCVLSFVGMCCCVFLCDVVFDYYLLLRVVLNCGLLLCCVWCCVLFC